MLSPFKSFEQLSWKGTETTGRVSEIDGVVESDEEGTFFALHKFAANAANSNPNVIEALFVDDRHIIHITKEGRRLRDNRGIFLSQRAAKTFTGYALSQLKRIKTHKSWIENPPKERPTRANFDLPEQKFISGDQINSANAVIKNYINFMVPWILDSDNQHKAEFWNGANKIVNSILVGSGYHYDNANEHWVVIEENCSDKIASTIGFDSNFIEYLRNEKRYSQAKQHYEQYQSWKKNRNRARADLESKYGYDVKHAMHLVRLLRMGEEVLTRETFDVYRPDQEELLAIRNGSLSYEELISWSNSRVNNIYDVVRSGKSVVPKEPYLESIEKLIIEIYNDIYV